LIRFTKASNHLGPDAQLGPVLGFAIKIFDIDGTKLVDDEPDSNGPALSDQQWAVGLEAVDL